MNRFRQLPQSLQVLFLAHLAGPFGFIAAALIQAPSVTRLPLWYLLAITAAYGVGPWLNAYFMLTRQREFTYVFAAEGTALIALAFLSPTNLPGAFIAVHAAFAVMLVITALVLVNRDIFLPLIFPEVRGWRREPRVAANQRASLRFHRIAEHSTVDLSPEGFATDASRSPNQGAPQGLKVMVEDCSLTGLAVYGAEDELAACMPARVRGEPVTLSCTIARKPYVVPLYCIWALRAGGLVRLGLQARDQEAMSRLFEALRPVQPERSLPRRLHEVWANYGLRRGLNYLLAAGLLGLLLLPPLFLEGGPGSAMLSALRSMVSDDAPSEVMAH